MTFRQIAGAILGFLVMFSTLLGVLGMWEIISGDAAFKTIGSSVIVGLGVAATSLVVDSFFGKPK